MSSRASIIADLKAHIKQVAPMRPPPQSHPTGISVLDDHIGGWPQPGIALVYGPVGTGRFRLILPTLQRITNAGHTVAIVDPVGWLYPPGLPNINMQHLMLIRCGADQAGWATTQLASCGAISVTILLDPPPLARHGSRLLRATEKGQSTAIVLGERVDPHLNPRVRLKCLGNNTARIERGAISQPTIIMG